VEEGRGWTPLVSCPTYLEKFIRDRVNAPFLLLSVVIVALPVLFHCGTLAVATRVI